MTSRKPTSAGASGYACLDWKARHKRAMQDPQSDFEKSLIALLDGLQRYARAHQIAYGSGIRDDGILGEAWFAIGEGLLGLLNGELGRLDGGTLDKAIRQLLEPQDEDKDASKADRTPEEEQEPGSQNLLSAHKRDEQ